MRIESKGLSVALRTVAVVGVLSVPCSLAPEGTKKAVTTVSDTTVEVLDTVGSKIGRGFKAGWDAAFADGEGNNQASKLEPVVVYTRPGLETKG